MRIFKIVQKNKNIILIFALVVFMYSCGENNSVDPATQRAINYISQNNTTIFKQELFENNITTELGDIKRELISSKNKVYTYKYTPILVGENIEEVFTAEGNVIWTNFTKKIALAGQNIDIDLKKIPIMNLDITSETLYLDTTLKVKIDIKEIVNSTTPIEINVDLKLISKLVNKFDENLIVKSNNLISKIFTNTISFSAKTNDPLLQTLRPDLNDLLVATGSFEITNWFTEQNTLGLVHHSETIKVKDEYITSSEVINSTTSRTLKDFAISNKK